MYIEVLSPAVRCRVVRLMEERRATLRREGLSASGRKGSSGTRNSAVYHLIPGPEVTYSKDLKDANPSRSVVGHPPQGPGPFFLSGKDLLNLSTLTLQIPPFCQSVNSAQTGYPIVETSLIGVVSAVNPSFDNPGSTSRNTDWASQN